MAVVPSEARFDLRARNVAYRSRKNVSLFSQSGSGLFSYSSRRVLEFALPSTNLCDLKTTTLNFSARINKTDATGLTGGDHFAMFDGSACSIIERVTISSGDGSVLEDISDAATFALFHIRARDESYALNTARKTLGYEWAVDNMAEEDDGTARLAKKRKQIQVNAKKLDTGVNMTTKENYQCFENGATTVTGKSMDFAIPLNIISGFFSSEKAFPLGWCATGSGSPALRVRITLAEPKVAIVATAGAAGNPPDATAVFDYEIQNPRLFYDELIPTDAFSLALSKAVSDSGVNGLSIFYSVCNPWTYTGLSGGNLVLSIPSHEFSIRSLIMALKPDDAPEYGKFNVSNNASMGINNGVALSAGSYSYPVTPFSWDHLARNTPSVLYNEYLKVLGKLHTESSTSGKLWDVSTVSGTNAVDDSYSRYICFNLDSSENGIYRSVENTINGVDTRSSSTSLNVMAQGTPYTGNYKAVCFVIADRLCGITAARGLVAGTAM